MRLVTGLIPGQRTCVRPAAVWAVAGSLCLAFALGTPVVAASTAAGSSGGGSSRGLGAMGYAAGEIALEPTPTPAVTGTASPSPTDTPGSTVTLTLESLLCASYGDVPANASPATDDATGGHAGELLRGMPNAKVDPATDNPGHCQPAVGWTLGVGVADWTGTL